MNQTAVYILWAAAIVIFGVLEAVTVQLVSIWFVFGSIGALTAALCGANFLTQVLIFIGVTVLTLLITRPIVKKHLKPKIESTNADRCIGKEAIVTETIDNTEATGFAKVGGSVWSARSDSAQRIEKGEKVKVERIEGVKLIVSKTDNQKE